jgi:hypothetical protein
VRTVTTTQSFKIDPITIFDVLHDLAVTGMLMTKSSMPMMGGKMEVEFLSSNNTGLNARYRWTGKVMWLPLDFTVVMTKWKHGVSKNYRSCPYSCCAMVVEDLLIILSAIFYYTFG